jgi:hypothetical protein
MRLAATQHKISIENDRRSGAAAGTPMLLKRSRTTGVSMVSLDAVAKRSTIATARATGNGEARPRGLASSAKDQVKTVASELEAMARRNPLGALAGTLVVGLIIGMMSRGRS